MKKWGMVLLCVCLLISGMSGCGAKPTPKIGVAFGVGPAARWPEEIAYMKAYAQEIGVELETRLNTDEQAKPFTQDCIELIDSGAKVLVIRPRIIDGMGEVAAYARQHKVKIISYDSLIEKEPIDLFVGYDGENTGQRLGRHLTERVPKGDYIFVWGDMNRNIEEMRRGAEKYLEPLDGQINILIEAEIPGWSPEECKRVVKETIAANDNKIDAIFAFNDKLAGACAEAVAELEITHPVAIAGMDAELDAVRRIVAGTQSCTAYMDIEDLAHTAIDEAVSLATNQKLLANCELDNGSGTPVQGYLLTRQIITKENLDSTLIETGHFTQEQVYGAGD